MKKIKKILAAVMTLAMVLGMSMTTFAAQGSATITISGADDATISYVQIVQQDSDSTIGWEFTDDEYADVFMEAFGVGTAVEAIQELIDIGGTGNATAEEGTINSSSELGDALNDLVSEATRTDNISDNVITVSSSGLYLIKAEQTGYHYIPMLAFVEDEGSGNLVDAVVTAKGSEDHITKNLTNPDEDSSVTAGDVIEYTATVEYPYYSADAQNKTFTVTDTLTNGTFVANSLSIKVGTDYTAILDTDYTVTPYANENMMQISFIYNSAYAGDEVTITYSATVGDGTDNVKNDIKTNFDVDGDSVTSDMVSVKVIKWDEDDQPLTGATFTLYEISKTAQPGFEEVTGTVQTKDQAEPNQTFYAKKITTGVTAGEDGSYTFTGLDAQKTYYVQETDAPSGYTVNDTYYALTGAEKTSAGGSKEYKFDDFDDITVPDENLSALPSTGGIGTTIFTVGGCIIMIAAAGLFFASRRKSSK